MKQDECDDPVNELLPWLLNGTLSAEEDARARRHVETCAVCREELDHLAEFAGTMSRRETPIASRPAAASSRLPVAIAASLLLPAMLGIYWAVLGFPTVRRSDMNVVVRLQPTATLELGAGPMRGAAVGPDPTLTLSPGVQRVAASFVMPTVADSSLVLELQDANGKVLARENRVRSFEDGTKCTYSFPADAFDGPGTYSIVLREGTGQHTRAFQYPFTVSIP